MENHNMTTNELIAYHLSNGYRVYSSAAGRVGEVMKVSEGDRFWPVEICLQGRPGKDFKRHRHTHAATTFDSGDKVVLQKHQNENYVKIVNKELM